MPKKIYILVLVCLSIISVTLLFPNFSALAADKETDAGPAVVEHETGFYYTVQRGDTLWDLSQKFSDSPWQWTELWKENDQIANPHRIYPGERIRLYRREGAHKYGDRDKSKSSKGPATDLKPSTEFFDFSYSAMDQVGFIRKEAVKSHGTIYKVRETKVMINSRDIIYIKPEAGASLAPGDLFTIYRTFNPIVDEDTNTYIGIQHYLTGVVQILQQEKDFSIGRVVAVYRPILINDKLMPYNRRLPRISLQESPEGLEGEIIDGEEHQEMIGDSVIAFIDKGQKDGVQPGQFYSLFYQDEHSVITDSGKQVIYTPVDFGELLVLHTEKSTATVIITRTEKEFGAGTTIRTPLQ